MSFSPLAAAYCFFYQKHFCWPIWLLAVTSSAAGVAGCPEPRPGVSPPAHLPALPALCHLRGAQGAWVHVPPPEASRAWRPLRPRLEAPPACHVPPAPSRLPCCWQDPVSKNSSGGDSSLGLKEGDESGEGRQLLSQTRWGGGVGGDTPWRHAPSQGAPEAGSGPGLPEQGLCQALGC